MPKEPRRKTSRNSNANARISVPSTGLPRPPSALTIPKANFEGAHLDDLLKQLARYEITEEDIWLNIPEVAKLAREVELENALPQKYVGPVDRDLLVGSLDAIKKMNKKVIGRALRNPSQENIIVEVGVPMIFSSHNAKDSKFSTFPFSGMMAHRAHKGNYLVCRTFRPPREHISSSPSQYPQ
ncbi:hypothetical protein SCHPADRAFT_450460 [Schizopora paradoxa]|uniref:Uncharacterized protein n=1 Tax=Schizopora paradoxa TaxID=27342 RepID=A0A0H2RIX1_9AGAM|nr:hypothetical protein SCHPADRAFT_450460 [Schizopora paradoxa]